jgi:hypothetical protein
MVAMADFEEKLRPVAGSLVAGGEELLGFCIGTRTGVFKGTQVVIVTTPGRLVIQGMDRKFAPSGDPVSITPDRIAKLSVDGAGGGWASVSAAIMDQHASTLKIRTTDGEKLNLMMMNGGDGLFGRLGGGQAQEQGVRAIADWIVRHADSQA